MENEDFKCYFMVLASFQCCIDSLPQNSLPGDLGYAVEVSTIFTDITPLKVSRDYRRLWIGNSLSAIGTQLTLVAVSLEIFALTGSSAYVGLLGAFALIPLIITGLYGGAIADHVDRRKVALYSALILWLTTVAICLHAWLGIENIWLLYGLIAVHSGASGINQPTRGAIIPALVGTELLASANALNMLSMSISMMLGPLLAGGLVATIGYSWTYTIDAVTFLLTLYAVYRLPALPPVHPEGQTPTDRKVGLRSVWEGFRFLATRKNLRMTFILDIIAMATAFPRAVLPAMGVLIIGSSYAQGINGSADDPAELITGLLLAGIAAGAFIAGLFSGTFTRITAQGKAVYWSIVVWGVSIALFGLFGWLAIRSAANGEPSLVLLCAAVAMLMVAGAADSVSGIFRNTILQTATPDHLRGRLQGVFIVVVAGGPRVGEMLTGAVSAGIGEAVTMMLGGLLCVFAATLAVRLVPGFLRYDARTPVA